MARRGLDEAHRLMTEARGHKGEASFGETLSVSKAGDSQEKALQSLTLAANPISTHLLLDGICLPPEWEVRAKHCNATRGFSGWGEALWGVGWGGGGLICVLGCKTLSGCSEKDRGKGGSFLPSP